MMAGVHFYSQDIPFKLSRPRKTRQWIKDVIAREKRALVRLNYIFCTDEFLLSVNQQYLHHNAFTDIITFDNSEEPAAVEGDIFISVERVKANAHRLKKSFDEEMHRVLIHGVLHLVGYGDKSAEEKSRMRKKEDAYLSLREN